MQFLENSSLRLAVFESDFAKVSVLRLFRPAIVLGKNQIIDRETESIIINSNLDLLRRKTAGGAVLFSPSLNYVEIFVKDVSSLNIPISMTAYPVGALINEIIGGKYFVVGRNEIKKADPSICFLSHYPGELLIGDRKVFGIATRRYVSSVQFDIGYYSKGPVWMDKLISDIPAELVQSQIGFESFDSVNLATLIFEKLSTERLSKYSN